MPLSFNLCCFPVFTARRSVGDGALHSIGKRTVQRPSSSGQSKLTICFCKLHLYVWKAHNFEFFAKCFKKGQIRYLHFILWMILSRELNSIALRRRIESRPIDCLTTEFKQEILIFRTKLIWYFFFNQIRKNMHENELEVEILRSLSCWSVDLLRESLTATTIIVI